MRSCCCNHPLAKRSAPAGAGPVTCHPLALLPRAAAALRHRRPARARLRAAAPLDARAALRAARVAAHAVARAARAADADVARPAARAAALPRHRAARAEEARLDIAAALLPADAPRRAALPAVEARLPLQARAERAVLGLEGDDRLGRRRGDASGRDGARARRRGGGGEGVGGRWDVEQDALGPSDTDARGEAAAGVGVCFGREVGGGWMLVSTNSRLRGGSAPFKPAGVSGGSRGGISPRGAAHQLRRAAASALRDAARLAAVAGVGVAGHRVGARVGQDARELAWRGRRRGSGSGGVSVYVVVGGDRRA
jgi:hypothetical protein